MPTLAVEALSLAAFAPFGDVIAPEGAARVFPINNGTTQRYHDLARIDTAAGDGRTVLSLFRALPRALPFEVHMLERHPLGSQAFVPLDPQARYLVVVAKDPQTPPRAFLAERGQGVNFRPGTWHHPLLALDRDSDFLVIDRDGPGENCDEAELPERWIIAPSPAA